MRRRLGLLLALAALAGGPAPARDTPSYSLIVTSNRDRDYDVYLATPEGRLRNVTRNDIRDDNVRLSPVGRWLAVARESFRTVLVSSDGRSGRVLARGTPDAFVTFSPAAFSPRGRLIALERYDNGVERPETWLASMSSGALRRLGFGAPAGGPSSWFSHEGPAFSPDGRRLAFSSPGALGFYDLDSGRRRIVAREQGIERWWWSPGWARLAFVRHDRAGVVVVDVGTGARRTIARSHTVRNLHWIGESAIGFEDVGDDDVIVADVSGGVRTIAQGSANWSPTGRYVAAVTWDSSATPPSSNLSIVRTNGRVLRTLSVASIDQDLAWAPGGTRFAAQAGRDLIVVDALRDRRPLLLAKNLWPVYEISWSPDGKTLALRGTGRIGLVPANGGRLRVIKGRGNNKLIGWLRP